MGWAARGLNFQARTPVFDGANDDSIEDSLGRLWFAERAGAIDPAPSEWSPEIDYSKVEKWLEERGYDGVRLFDDNIKGEASCHLLNIARANV